MDKGKIQTQRIKDNTITVKEKIEELSNTQNDENQNNYATNKVENYGEVAIRKFANQYNQRSRRAYHNTKENIAKTKQKIDNYKKNQAKKNIKNNIIKKSKTNNKINLTRKSIKTSERVIKNTEKVTKETIKTSQKLARQIKLATEKIVKTTKTVAKLAVKTVKSIASGIKAIASLIIAGGWIAVIIIVAICLISYILISVFNSSENIDIENPASNYQLVMIAKSQLGNEGGEKFWKCYGFSERVEWCACFVSWCAEENGDIEKENIPKFSLCGDGIEFFKSKERYFERETGYIPKAGDIIFFDWIEDGVQNGVSDHVGIVESVDIEKQEIHTIEGNSGNKCKENRYEMNNIQIMGYGTGYSLEINFEEIE